MQHTITKLSTLVVMGTFAASVGFVLPSQAALKTTLAPTTEERQFGEARMVIRGDRGFIKMLMNDVPDAVGSPCAVILTLSINGGEDFELRLDCEVVDEIDTHSRQFDRVPNYAVLRASIVDEIDPPLENGDLVRFGGADVFINDEYRATVGGVFQEERNGDRTRRPTNGADPNGIEPTDRTDLPTNGIDPVNGTDAQPVEAPLDTEQ